MKYDIVIYHAGCSDGFCAAWIASRAGCVDAQFVPAYYGTEPPDVAGKKVLIADFSYKLGVLCDMAGAAAQVTVLDHHKTAEAELTQSPGGKWPWNLYAYFNQDKSGGRITWEHFHPGEKAPPIVDYTEDRDLWRWKLLHSREINAALRSYPMTFEQWDSLHVRLYDNAIALKCEGDAILRYQQGVVDSHVGFAVEADVAGHKVPCVNATTMTSEIAGKLAKGKPFAAVWFQRMDGKRVYSLRSDENGMDVSEVAKSMGGGGHKHAAGFEE